jgi:hypothetical protein
MKKLVKILIIVVIVIIIALLIYFFLTSREGNHICKTDSDCVPLGGCYPGCWNKYNQPRDSIFGPQRLCGLRAPVECGCIENMCMYDYGSYKAKINNVTGGDFVPSANYYEGTLFYNCIGQNCKIYISEPSIFVCTGNWSWVKIGSCYEINDLEVQRNIQNHKYSMELSGCYVGSLKEVNCI